MLHRKLGTCKLPDEVQGITLFQAPDQEFFLFLAIITGLHKLSDEPLGFPVLPSLEETPGRPGDKALIPLWCTAGEEKVIYRRCGSF